MPVDPFNMPEWVEKEVTHSYAMDTKLTVTFISIGDGEENYTVTSSSQHSTLLTRIPNGGRQGFNSMQNILVGFAPPTAPTPVAPSVR